MEAREMSASTRIMPSVQRPEDVEFLDDTRTEEECENWRADLYDMQRD